MSTNVMVDQLCMYLSRGMSFLYNTGQHDFCHKQTLVFLTIFYDEFKYVLSISLSRKVFFSDIQL
jgi:hypothetical protein